MHLTYRDSPVHTSTVSAASAETGAPEIEVTREMIEAGAAELCAHDGEFEPAEAAVFKIFRSMLALHRTRIMAVAASEVERSLSPYLEPESAA